MVEHFNIGDEIYYINNGNTLVQAKIECRKIVGIRASVLYGFIYELINNDVVGSTLAAKTKEECKIKYQKHIFSLVHHLLPETPKGNDPKVEISQ